VPPTPWWPSPRKSTKWCASSTFAHAVITLPCDHFALLFVKQQCMLSFQEAFVGARVLFKMKF
jgi:hypothetical protein